MQNRRRSSRWCVGKPIKVKLTGALAFLDCVLIDINFSGLQITLGRKLPQDSFRGLTIVLCEKHGDGSTFRPLGSGKVEPSPGFLEVEVWVVWHKTVAHTLHLYGIYFSKIRESEARVEDVSAKGIGMMVDKELKLNDDLELWLLFPDGIEPLYVRGRVAWQKELAQDLFRVGINLEKADMMGLGRVLRAEKQGDGSLKRTVPFID
ncbi:MAG: PilZ domain-containing protein [Candidatus Omnitrophica bacterium]|nr:PilZ domain-containing protein [Candidatus Omnitrophota bacterium]